VRQRFEGAIAGIGSTSGVRVVVGRWDRSPLGSFADAMVAEADGRRVLLAPNQDVADFVAATYSFDEVKIEPLTVEGVTRWLVRSPSLLLDLQLGHRTTLGRLLRAVPEAVGTSPAWCTVTDPVARVVMRGVRTRGSAGNGRREWYAATDHHVLRAATGSYAGVDLGALRPVRPEPGFGFSSTPARPSVTSLVTTVEVPG
jgi:hypothetical protein